MTVLGRALRAEIAKITSLPTLSIAFVLALLPAGITAIATAQGRAFISRGEMSVEEFLVGLGVEQLILLGMAPMVIGAVVTHGEFIRPKGNATGATPWQMSALTIPRRWPVILSKVVVTVISTMTALGIAFASTAGVIYLMTSDLAPMEKIWPTPTPLFFGLALQWVMWSCLSLSLTLICRSATIPLVILIVNSSLVSFSLLLARATDLVKFLPDVASYSLIVPRIVTDNPLLPPTFTALTPEPAAAVMVAWAVIPLLLAGAITCVREGR
ncbi:MAG: hypothetical protein Q4C87_03840 [Actinomycetaceae bacterium]|nr:hypothetical protein [Actinomycetaceae bacterium]